MSQPSTGGVPLEEWRKDVPPGWKPGLESYPLKLFFAKLKLWYRCCEVPDEVVGPLIAGRLQGGAQRLALELKLIRPDGGYDIGDAALVRLSVDEVLDPNDGITVIQHHIPSGVQALCNALRDTYGDNDEQQTTRALENFFEFRRPHSQSLQEYAADWELRLDEAKLRAGLDLNNVAKSYLWLKQSGLSQRHQDDLRLQVQGDMSRFHDIRALAVRLSHRVDKGQSTGDVFYDEEIDHSSEQGEWHGWPGWEHDEDYWTDAWWTEDAWFAEDGSPEGTWYEDEEYYEAEEIPWQGDPASEPGYQGEDRPSYLPTASTADYETDGVYSSGGGRGKGAGPFGSGCHVCGSKWHRAADCPVQGKGKGPSSSFPGSHGKGKSKGKGKPSKGKGKGKGKYKGKSARKGRGKGWPSQWSSKGSWSSPDEPRSWMPRYFASVDEDYDEEWEPYQLRHARVGLHLGDSPPKDLSKNAPQPARQSSTTKYFDIGDSKTGNRYFEDLLTLERAQKPTTSVNATNAESSEGQGAESSQDTNVTMPAKTLEFFFRKNGDNEDESPRHRTYHEKPESNDVYHTVNGRRRRGLIIDPGAANGLVGTETLRDLLQHIDKAKQVSETIVWRPRQAEVTGISGSADTTLGEITMPLPMLTGIKEANYKADVIGGEASVCPALVGNPALVNMSAVLAANWFTNRDGLLAIPHGGDLQLIRLLYTDSRHYLLPLDEETSATELDDEKNKAKTFLASIQEKSTTRWNDVRNWFTWATTAKPKRSDYNLNEEPSHHLPHGSASSNKEEQTTSTATTDALVKNEKDSGVNDQEDSLDRVETSAATDALVENEKDLGVNDQEDSLDRVETSAATDALVENEKDSGGHNVQYIGQPTMAHATQVLTADMQMTAEHEAKFSMPVMYHGDHYPSDLSEHKRAKLDRQYRAIKEEYYTKSGQCPVTPENFSEWKQTRRAQRKSQFWEICSGSGRLSYVALLAGLAVTFPVDYRYGWDLSNREHQEMLLQAQTSADPDCVMFSPSCGPWSQSANRLSMEDQEALRQEERQTLQFIKRMAQSQADRGKGFVVENPWGSALWKHSALANLENEIEGCRPKQRCDQCAYGATEEKGKPIQKATGFQANFSLRQSTHRCRGHKSGHGVLQATFQGMNRTTLAAVYPHQLCRAIVKDVKKFLSKVGAGVAHFIGYKCEKCALGKDAPPGTEHTLVPRECRHASALPTPGEATSSSNAAPTPSPPVRTAVTTPIPQLLEEYKRNALKKPNLDEIKLQLPTGFTMTAVDTVMLKSLLVDLVNDSVNIISEMKGKHNHWSQDPLHIAVLRRIFFKVINVKGVCVSLHAESYPMPMPFLRTESAPLRMIIRGDVKAWTMKTVEDLRTYTDQQLKAKFFVDDWVIAVFGSSPQDKDHWEIDRTRGRVLRHHLQPRVALFTPREDEGPINMDELASSRTTIATPYDEPGPRVVIRDDWTSRDSSRAALEHGRWTGATEFITKLPEDDDDEPADPVLREAEAHEQAMDAQEQLEDAEQDEADLMEDKAPLIDPPRRSNFDFRRVLVRLPRLVKSDVDQAKRLLLGLHERFWHSTASDLQSLLSRAGMPSDVVKLVPEVVASCAICRKYSRLKSKPAVKTNHPMVFGEEVQADYFQLWNQWFMILIDVATRYKIVVKVAGRDLPTALQVLLHHWLRFFGPMRRLVSDQESCLMSHEAAAELERLNIKRDPAGTTRGRAQGQHTITGLVEKHTELVKLHMLKIHAEAERTGLETNYADIAAEAGFAQNATINIGGYTPHMLVTGSLPFPFYDIDSAGLQATSGANMTRPTVFETALRLRQIALTAATQSIMEDRIARAGHTRPQRVQTESLKPGVSEIEFHREDADGLGWRGPGLLLKLQDNGSAIVEYQGRPYLIPLRNLRMFRGTYYADYHGTVDNRRKEELDSWLALRSLMQSTEAGVPFRQDTFGHLLNNQGKWTTLPKTMDDKQRQGILEEVVMASAFLTAKECHGVIVGVGLRKIITPANTTGTLIAWLRNTVRMSIVDNPKGTNMSTVPFRISGREEMCYTYFFSYAANYVEPPASAWAPRGTPMEESPVVPQAPHAAGGPADQPPMDVDSSSMKRDGPDSRTVVLGPEGKKQRTSFSLPPSEYMAETFLAMHRAQCLIQPEDEPLDHFEHNFIEYKPTSKKDELFYMSSHGWYADLFEGSIFRVDTTTGNISEDDVYGIWPEVEEGDMKEVAQFVEQQAFSPVRLSDLGKDVAVIDAIWVRKWKKAASGRIVKSRLCARGCHDPYKNMMSNRSTTATRLSQRLILMSAVNVPQKTLESWDVAGAFLKGLTYDALWRALRELGLNTVERMIAIIPPLNVWRHLRKLSKKFDIPESELQSYIRGIWLQIRGNWLRL